MMHRRGFIAGAAALALSALVLLPGIANSRDGSRRVLLPGNSIPSWVKPGAKIDIDFAGGRIFGCPSLSLCLSITRASNATDLLPSSPSGFAYHTYGSNVLAISAGVGLLIFEARTNQLLNSATPATQTTGSLANGTYTLWVNGSGSATMSTGTATGCGTGVATQGTPVNFTTSGAAGTCTVTVAGSLNAEQLELGAFGTSFIVTVGAPLARSADNITAISTLQSVFFSSQFTSAVRINVVTNNGIIGAPGIIYVGDDTTNNRWASYVSGTGTLSGRAVIATVSTSPADPAGTININTTVAAGMQASNGAFGVSLNGVTTTSAPSGLPTRTIARIGANQGAGAFLNGSLRRLTVSGSYLNASAFASWSTLP